MDPILTTSVAAVALGVAGQIIAERFQLPAILPLLVLGILCGPFGVGLVHPEALGHSLETLIHLGVAIILFEGGLSLDPQRLSKVGEPVRNLLTIGVGVTAVGASWLAQEFVGLSWPAAALFGAVVTVTGPTVIVPLLRHMIAPREVKTILVSEGLIVDPIGAILAYVVLQWIQRAGIPFRVLTIDLITLAATGVILGFVAGALARLVLRSRIVGGELRNLSILALVMMCYLTAEYQAAQSGILAAMVMGFTISAAELPDLVSVKAFKGQVTTLVISVLFILLAAQLDLTAVLDLGWSGAVVVAGLVVLVRPIAVVLSIWPSHLDWRGRTVVGLTAPRGIVAAAVASLAAREMTKADIAGGVQMEGLVYLSILATGVWSTVVAVAAPRLLGFTSDPERRRAVLVGAHALTEAIAKILAASGRMTVVVDGVPWRLERFRNSGIATVCGDARDAVTYEEAGVERDSLVVSATTNDELNLLVAELVHTEFGVEHPVVAIQRPPDELGRRSRAWLDLLGGRSIDVSKWNRRIENGQAHEMRIDATVEEVAALLRQIEREHPAGVVRLAGFENGEPTLRVGDGDAREFKHLDVLVAEGRAWEALGAVHSQSQTEGSESDVPDGDVNQKGGGGIKP